MKYQVNSHTSGSSIGIDPTTLAGLVLYYDATNAASITKDPDTNKVSSWVSQGSSSVTLRQLAPETRPELVPADDSLGCSSIEFSGDQYLEFNPGGQIVSPTDIVFMGFLPTRFDTTNSAAVLAGFTENDIVGVQFLGAPDNNAYILRKEGTTGTYVSQGHFTEYLESRVLTLLPTEAGNPVRLDNHPIPLTTVASTDPEPVSILRLGQGRTSIDDPSPTFTRIAFVAIFRGVTLSEAELEGVAQFFRAKMGLVKYPAALGGVSRLDGNHVVKVFSTTSELNVVYPGSADLLLVGGGGGGGYGAGGGGGGGGFRDLGATLVQEIYPVTIGSGGGGALVATAAGSNGEPTSFGEHVALGGGGGGSPGVSGAPGQTGGAGGGAPGGTTAFAAGEGTTGQGYSGGQQGTLNTNLSGAGGGGAASPGEDSASPPLTDYAVLGGYGFDRVIEGELKTYSEGGWGANVGFTGNVAPVDLHNGQGGNAGGVLGAGQPGSSGVAVVKYAGRDFAYSHPLWDNLVLLIHSDRRTNSRQVVDSSSRNNHVFVGGRVRHTRNQGFRRSSIRFDKGANDVLSVSDANFEIGSQDFTVSAWVSIDIAANNGSPFGLFQLSTVPGGRDAVLTDSLVIGAAADFSWVVGDNDITTSTNSVRTQWQHIAVSRTGGVTRLFLDGLELGSFADTTEYAGIHACIGGNVNGTRSMLGYLEDFQLIVGASLYDKDFVPSQERILHGEDIKADPYSNYVSVFIDAEKVSPSADVLYDQSRFNRVNLHGRAGVTSDAYSGRQAFKFAGDLYSYLDIARSYLSATALSFGSDDFCIEFRCRKIESTPSVAGEVLSTLVGSFGVSSIGVSLDAASGFVFKHDDFQLVASVNCDDGVWHHYAVVKHDDLINLYVDGISLASGTHTEHIGAPASPDTYCIGRYLSGSIDNFRVTKGVPRYFGSFINPSAGLLQLFGEIEDPHFNQVALLLPFDDVASANTIQDHSKYAHENIALDTAITIGTEYATNIGFIPYGVVEVDSVSGLRFPKHRSFSLTGDFTIEFMANIADEYPGGYGTVISTDPSNGSGMGGWVVELSTTAGFRFYNDAAGYSTPTIAVDGEWHHYVIQRSGVTMSMYIDGIYYINFQSDPGATPFEAGQDLTIGQMSNGVYPFKGKLKNLRITKGVARYTGAFVPNLGPMPRLPYESSSLLSKTSFMFQGLEADFYTKEAESGHLAVEGAEVSVGIDNETYFEGAAYFNGTEGARYEFQGVYSLEDGLPYCIEFFVNPHPTVNEDQEVVLATSALADAEEGWLVELSSVNGLRFIENVSTLQEIETAFPFDGAEHHVAILRREDGSLSVFIDGVLVITAAGVLPTVTKVGVLALGDIPGGSAHPFVGSVRGVRITLGSARYGDFFAVPELPYYEPELTPSQVYGKVGMHLDFSQQSTVTAVANKAVTVNNLYPYNTDNIANQPVGGFQLDYLRTDEVGKYVVEGNKSGFLPFTVPIDVRDLTLIAVGKSTTALDDGILSAVFGSIDTPKAVFGWVLPSVFTSNGNDAITIDHPGLFAVNATVLRVREGAGYSLRSAQLDVNATDDPGGPLLTDPDTISTLGRYGGSEYWWLEGQIGEAAVVDRAIPVRRLDRLVGALQRKWLLNMLFDGRPAMLVSPAAWASYPGEMSSSPGTWLSDSPLTFTYLWKNSSGDIVGTEALFNNYAYVYQPLYLTIVITNEVGSVIWNSDVVYMTGEE